MNNTQPSIRKFSSEGQKIWMTDDHQKIFFGDVLDESQDARLDVTFIRWSKGERGEFDFPLPYDEVFIVTKGSYTVRTADREVTAKVGEILYLQKGVTGVYFAHEDAEVIAVTSPPYRKALREAGRGDDLNQLREVKL